MMKLREEGFGGTEGEKITILENMIIPSIRLLEDMRKDNALSGGFFEGQRSAALILNAGSDEEVDSILSSLPCSSVFEVETIPLESFKEALKRDENVLKGIKAASS